MSNCNLSKKIWFCTMSLSAIVLISLLFLIKCKKKHTKHVGEFQKDISEISSDMKNMLRKVSSLINTVLHNSK
jgi:uncharacterized protein YoxC